MYGYHYAPYAISIKYTQYQHKKTKLYFGWFFKSIFMVLFDNLLKTIDDKYPKFDCGDM